MPQESLNQKTETTGRSIDCSVQALEGIEERSRNEIEAEIADLRADDRTLGLRAPNYHIASQRQWIQRRIRQLCGEVEAR